MNGDELTVKILQGIREDIQKANRDSNERFETMDRRFENMERRFETMDRRFEFIETAIRDMAEQLVLLARGVKVAIEARERFEARVDDHEARLKALEARAPH